MRRIALAVVSPLVFMSAIEAALRVSGYGFDAGFFQEREDRVMTNPRYGWQYFPPTIARAPEPLVFSARKQPGVRRTFVLGESAAMGFPDPRFGLARYLAGEKREVINASMTAISSHAIAGIARECARYEADDFVVYMGNNEVIGPYAFAAGPGEARARMWANRFRATQWIGSLIRKPPLEKEWRGMEMFLDRRVRWDDARLEAVYSNFRQNLAEVIRVGRRAGAEVIVCTIAVNLRDCPPFAGEEARAAWKAGDFSRARDLDELRFRADSRINAIIREVAATEGARLVDAEKAIAPDATAFWEHVHLRPEANRALAALIRGGPVRQIEVTAWDRARLARSMRALTGRAPFGPEHRRNFTVPQADYPAAIAAYRQAVSEAPDDLVVGERLAELLQESGDYLGASAEWRRLLGRIPWLPAWRTGLAESLLLQGRQAEARSEYEAALALDAGFLAAHIGLGTVLFQSGRTAEAEARFRRAIEINPNSAQAHHNLGMALGAAGWLDEAIPELESAVRLDPALTRAHYNLAGALARKGLLDRAVAHYLTATELDPNFADAHYDLGAIRARQGKLDEAIRRYREAARANPRHADALNNWGTALARQGRMREAAARFEDALRVDPSHAQARRNLELARRQQR